MFWSTYNSFGKILGSAALVVAESKKHELVGWMAFRGGEDRFAFSGAADLLLKMDRMYDELSLPKAAFSGRRFGKMKNIQKKEKAGECKLDIREPDREKSAVFIIKVRFRQNATWQGQIEWINENRIQYFRSELELLRLMDYAVSSVFGDDDGVAWE